MCSTRSSRWAPGSCGVRALALVDVEETGPDGAALTRTILRQYPAACGGAGACLDLCPEDALSAPEHWGLDALLEDDVVDLDESAKAVCRRWLSQPTPGCTGRADGSAPTAAAGASRR